MFPLKRAHLSWNAEFGKPDRGRLDINDLTTLRDILVPFTEMSSDYRRKWYQNVMKTVRFICFARKQMNKQRNQQAKRNWPKFSSEMSDQRLQLSIKER